MNIPPSPTKSDVREALELIQEVICDFPFVDEASRANASAAMLTPICRPAISGPTPLALIDAPQAGIGEGLLADVISLIATGRHAALYSAQSSADEWRKQLTTILSEGSSVVIFDNLEGCLKSAQLSKALTAETWADRILSKNQAAVLPVRCSWLATGNNIRLGGDIPRRCFQIRMDPQCPRPFERTDFRHPNLKAFVKANRIRLIRALP